jgi:hypothetical protein
MFLAPRFQAGGGIETAGLLMPLPEEDIDVL